MHASWRIPILTFALLFLGVGLGIAEPFDPDLSAKADGFQTHLNQWHRPGLGALLAVEYTDAGRTEAECYHYQGDSTIWTGMYLGSQAIRYIVTGDPDARDQELGAR